MPMGIVSSEDFEIEKKQVEIKRLPDKGRGNGNNGVPDSLRKIIGETSSIDGRQEGLSLANQFGISPSSVSAYSNGSTSTASYDSPTEIKNHIDDAKERISKSARIRLRKALHHITDEKLEGAKLTELSSVAKDMAGIIKVMEPEREANQNQNGPIFVFYAPQIREEKGFDYIEVKE